ncbi:hypothetical protein FAIPA1_330028 [Frankia sp. AiPs1]
MGWGVGCGREGDAGEEWGSGRANGGGTPLIALPVGELFGERNPQVEPACADATRTV